MIPSDLETTLGPRRCLRLPVALDRKIEEFRKQRRLIDFSDTARELLWMAIDQVESKKEKE